LLELFLAEQWLITGRSVLDRSSQVDRCGNGSQVSGAGLTAEIDNARPLAVMLRADVVPWNNQMLDESICFCDCDNKYYAYAVINTK